jgi:hypothetical protein
VVLAVLLAGCSAQGQDANAAPPASTTSTAPRATDLPTFDPATTVGGYAPGFPLDLLQAPADATVLASSAAPAQEPLVDVTLNLSSPRATRDVLKQVSKRLRKAGFEESGIDARSGLTAHKGFKRVTERRKGPIVETLLVGVLDEGDRRLVTLSGSVVVPD